MPLRCPYQTDLAGERLLTFFSDLSPLLLSLQPRIGSLMSHWDPRRIQTNGCSAALFDVGD
jgi:hypothetical protein